MINDDILAHARHVRLRNRAVMWSEQHRESGIFRVKICLLNPRCIFVYPRRIT